MLLIDDAGRLWRKLWSVRLALAAAALDVVAVATQELLPEHAPPHLVAAAGVLSLAAAVARLVAQPRVTGYTYRVPPPPPTRRSDRSDACRSCMVLLLLVGLGWWALAALALLMGRHHGC